MKKTEKCFPFKRASVQEQIPPAVLDSSSHTLPTKAPGVCFSSNHSWPLCRGAGLCLLQQSQGSDSHRGHPLWGGTLLPTEAGTRIAPPEKSSLLRRFHSSHSSRTHSSPRASTTVSQLSPGLKAQRGEEVTPRCPAHTVSLKLGCSSPGTVMAQLAPRGGYLPRGLWQWPGRRHGY